MLSFVHIFWLYWDSIVDIFQGFIKILKGYLQDRIFKYVRSITEVYSTPEI